MNIYTRRYCQPCRKPPKKRMDSKKLGIAMLLLGIVTALTLFLPLKYISLLLSIVLAIFGILVLKSSRK